MTTTQATAATYRKTKTGEWVAYGPADSIVAGSSVQVAKRDGSVKTEQVSRVGRPFAVAGVEMVYGYLAPKTAASTSGRAYAHTSRYRRGCEDCGSDVQTWSQGYDASTGRGLCHDCV